MRKVAWKYCFILKVVVDVAQIFTRVVALVGSLIVVVKKFDAKIEVFSWSLIIVLFWVWILVAPLVVALIVALWVLGAALSPLKRCLLMEFCVPQKLLL